VVRVEPEKRGEMTGWLAQVPGKLLFVALVGVALTAALTLLLAWHALRRLFGVPRVTRPPAMYVALTGFWLALVAGCSVAIATIALLRDYRRIDQPTELAEVRCAPVGQDRVQMELRPSPLAAPERYEVEGDACVVWVNRVELRPGLGRLGLHALSRIERVGQVARPSANPAWLSPRPQRAHRLVNLLVRSADTVPVAVPRDAGARVVLVSSPTGPVIRPSSI
jgi:hypothetical protein